MNTLEQLRSGALQGTSRLKLCEGLRELPEEVFELADTLEVLDLSGNELTDLPADLSRLHRLKVIFASNNGQLALGLLNDKSKVRTAAPVTFATLFQG